jgi:hypothetical protein
LGIDLQFSKSDPRRMTTTTLQIEHAILDFDTWRAAFERDPIGRERSGVRSYRILRPFDDPHYVIIELDFDGASEARGFLARLEQVWKAPELSPALPRSAESGGGSKPKTRVVEQVERRSY